MRDCLFCKISAKEIPAAVVYENSAVIAFLDINPVNPGHTLIVPKKHVDGLHDADEATLRDLILATQRLAIALSRALNTDGFNVEENNGAIAGQIIPHLHFHVIPRRPNDGLHHWPGTPYAEGEREAVAEKIRGVLK